MKQWIVAAALVLTLSPAGAQAAKGGKTDGHKRDVNDKIELRELVDTFSILADKKDVQEQLALFTANATVETYRDGMVASKLIGREEIGNAFANFLKNFETVYHFNGQHVVAIQGDRATGDLYCMTYLFSTDGGKKIKTTFGIRYKDEYVREGGKWLISKRTSFFEWQERDERP